MDQECDGYMEEEEEWDREGLLDPAWEKQQKKVSPTTVSWSVLLVCGSVCNSFHFIAKGSHITICYKF